MIAGASRLDLAGEELWMLPDRALLWPAQDALLVADTHFGKSRIFRHHGIAVPAGADANDRERLQRLLQVCGTSRLFVLGDFLHGALAADDPEIRALETWLADLSPVRLTVIAGNHDRHVLRHWKPAFEWRTEGLRLGQLYLTHDVAHKSDTAASGDIVSGHVHPVWRARRSRLSHAQIPVFWRNAAGLVLPSFGSLTGGFRVKPARADRLFAVADDAVMLIPDRHKSTA